MRSYSEFYEIDFDAAVIQGLLMQKFPGLSAIVSRRAPTQSSMSSLVITVAEGEASMADLMGGLRPLARDFGYGDADVQIIVHSGLQIIIPTESEHPSISRRTTHHVVADLAE